jgi:hypothetical protein
MKVFAPMILRENNIRSLLGKGFNLESPESDLMAVVFQTTRAEDVINSMIVDNNGSWEEEVSDSISPEKHDLMRK